jgi:hypothetical protein
MAIPTESEQGASCQVPVARLDPDETLHIDGCVLSGGHPGDCEFPPDSNGCKRP